MHPLHEYVARQLGARLKSRRVVVWYDARQEFAPFVGELRGDEKEQDGSTGITVDGLPARLVEYDGSFLGVRAVVEPYVSGDEPESVVVYVPGCERNRVGSVLMEPETAGDCYEPQIRRLARNVLRQRYTDGIVDDLLAPERLTYVDLARVCEGSTAEPPSILKGIFHDATGTDGLLAAWLMADDRDGEIEAKEAAPELAKLVRSRLGLELPEDRVLAKARAIALRYVLAGEFRSDLRGSPPAVLESIPMPSKKDELGAVRELARRLRTSFAVVYAATADRVEAELGLQNAKIAGDALGSIDTFRFEERALLSHCGELIVEARFQEALDLVGERERSFWLDRDLARKAQWEACRRMAELGSVATSIKVFVSKAGGKAPSSWIDAYTADDGWYRLDQAQRRMEAWVANLDDEPEEWPLGVVRRTYDETCQAMAIGFTKALVGANWHVDGAPTAQTRIYAEVVVPQPRPTAYFLVDAMRFEMGKELAERLPASAEVSVRPALGSLPSITPIGMGALLPGAAASFSVAEQGGKLGALIDGAFLSDLSARHKFAASRVPNLVDISLDELLGLQGSRLAKRVEDAKIVVVRSQEIDHAGEAGFTYHARQVMDSVIDNLARAVRKLAAAGIEHSVIAADHGHLFFPTDREQSMRIDGPGGDQVDLHRRCRIGRGGATPPACVRVAAATLGYPSDLDFVFPIGTGVFKAGGDLAFHHGGTSLQELIIPVLTVRLKLRDPARPAKQAVSASGLPEAVTNRIFSVTLQLGGPNLSLFAGPTVVRPSLLADGKQVGAIGMAVDADYDRAAGTVKLEPGKPVTVAFLLTDETVPALRVIVQDPVTDVELYRSPADIPVRLGM